MQIIIISSSRRRRTKFYLVLKFRREYFVLRRERSTKRTPPPHGNATAMRFYSRFSTNTCGGATASFSRTRCRATMTPFSYDRVLYGARAHSQQCRLRSHRRHSHVALGRSLSHSHSRRRAGLDATLTHTRLLQQQQPS